MKLDSVKISSEAHALSNEIQTMEFMTCLVIWNDMLTEITRASTAMQSADISLDTAVLFIDNLKKLFSQYREDGFEKAVTDARLLAN